MLALNIYQDEETENLLETLRLGESLLEDGTSGFGKPIPLYVKNEGDSILVTANIDLEGPGADKIQLARDENGKPGIWAQPGLGIVALATDIKPGEIFRFWARGSFNEDDAAIRQDFSFSIEMVGRNE